MKYDRIKINESDLVINGRQVIPAADIVSYAYAPEVIHMVKRDAPKDDMPRFAVLALELNRPYRQPSRRFMPAGRSLILRLEPERGCPQIPWARKAAPLCEDRLTADSGVVEAKIRMNSYTRAATTGTNAYGKPGLVAPVVDITVYPFERRANIKYLGTTSRMFRSRYYKEHSDIDFMLDEADNTRFAIIQAPGRTEAVAEYEIRRIERDERGSGVWYLKLTRTCGRAVQAVSWILALAGDACKQKAPAPEGSERDADSIAMLDALHHRGILTDGEWRKKRAFLVEQHQIPDSGEQVSYVDDERDDDGEGAQTD